MQLLFDWMPAAATSPGPRDASSVQDADFSSDPFLGGQAGAMIERALTRAAPCKKERSGSMRQPTKQIL